MASTTSKRQYLLSSLDQLLTSAGSFLLIIIGANYLGLHDQGKLAYIFSAYMFTVLVNVAVFFYSAPLVNCTSCRSKEYSSVLQWAQLFFALLSSTSIILFFILAGDVLSWNIAKLDALLFMLFLIFQQLADFKRREGYVFTTVYESVKFSSSIHITRILLLLLFQPSDIREILIILGFASLWGLSKFLLDLRSFPFRLKYLKLEEISKHIALSRYSIANAPLSWALFFFPVVLLGALHSPAVSGILLSIRSFTGVANILLEQLETIIPAQLSKIFHKDGVLELKKRSWRLFNFGLVIWIIVSVVIFYFGDWAILIFLGDEYVQNSNILFILWVGSGIHFASRILGIRWRVTHNPKVELVSSLGGVIVLLGCIPLIASKGLMGGALAFVYIPLGMIATQVLYIYLIKGR